MNYSVSDFIIRIKNAALAKRRSVILPYSNLNKAIGKILVKENFLNDIKESEVDKKKSLVASIRYEKRESVLNSVRVVSKPSLRIYIGAGDITKIERKGLKTIVLSTSKGVLTGKEAKEKEVGGELLFEIS